MVNTQDASVAKGMIRERSGIVMCQQHDVAMVSVGINNISPTSNVICHIINSEQGVRVEPVCFEKNIIWS